jgi:hypothetical protein
MKLLFSSEKALHPVEMNAIGVSSVTVQLFGPGVVIDLTFESNQEI